MGPSSPAPPVSSTSSHHHRLVLHGLTAARSDPQFLFFLYTEYIFQTVLWLFPSLLARSGPCDSHCHFPLARSLLGCLRLGEVPLHSYYAPHVTLEFRVPPVGSELWESTAFCAWLIEGSPSNCMSPLLHANQLALSPWTQRSHGGQFPSFSELRQLLFCVLVSLCLAVYFTSITPASKTESLGKKQYLIHLFILRTVI